MKTIYIGILLVLLNTCNVFSQKVIHPKSIINTKTVEKYHVLKELQAMNKGQLIPLYKERVRVLFNVFPYIGVTPKPGVSFQDLGIPSNKENISTLDKEIENRNVFISENEKFLDLILPYSDTSNIINAILFYEEVLKTLSIN